MDTPPAMVLVVDDDAQVREFVSHCLRQRGYAVLEAPNGAAGLWTVAECRRPIDLLLTDVMMPAMDGRELARRFQRQCAGAKVLFMSGYNRLELPYGSAFLPKPFTAQALLRKVGQALAGEQTRGGAAA